MRDSCYLSGGIYQAMQPENVANYLILIQVTRNLVRLRPQACAVFRRCLPRFFPAFRGCAPRHCDWLGPFEGSIR